jgi:hypothetical protein
MATVNTLEKNGHRLISRPCLHLHEVGLVMCARWTCGCMHHRIAAAILLPEHAGAKHTWHAWQDKTARQGFNTSLTDLLIIHKV